MALISIPTPNFGWGFFLPWGFFAPGISVRHGIAVNL
jgi:hypothetical protein